MGTPVAYWDGDQLLEGYFAAPHSASKAAGILIAPSWLNVTTSICTRADRLAESGYAVFVADVFGASMRPGPPQAPIDVIRPFMEDRYAFRRRLSAALPTLQSQRECEPDRVAAIGYCFGGCGVLELARSGLSLRGVVSIHGDLSASLLAPSAKIKAKILVLHGDEDPVAPFEMVQAFRQEMRAAHANWQLTIYGGASHGFTGEGTAGIHTPEAILHQQAERRSWQAILSFLEEVLR